MHSEDKKKKYETATKHMDFHGRIRHDSNVCPPGGPNMIMPERHFGRGSRKGMGRSPSVFMHEGEVLQNR